MNTPLIGSEMRAMRRELATAPDAQLLQILSLVDSMADRGQADGLLAPLRDRLRQLRPARPLRFTRLLFKPLDPVIVAANTWRSGQPLLPRTAIEPLSELIRRALPAQAEVVERAILSSAEIDAARVLALGRILWPDAARVLRAAEPPPAWPHAGLRAADFIPLSRAVAVCLETTARIGELADASIPAPELNAALARLLEEAGRAGLLAWGMMLAILLQRFPHADAPRDAALLPRADKLMREAAGAALARSLDWITQTTDIPGLGDLDEAAGEVRRQVTLLEKYHADPTQRGRAIELAKTLRNCLTAQMEVGVQLRLLAPLRARGKTAAAKTGLDQIENDARALRRLELELRRLGGQTGQLHLRAAADEIRARADLEPMERARLIEILLGAQEAMAFLAAQDGVSQSGSGR